MFQSTPPHGGRRNRGIGKRQTICFNPRPRMGGDHQHRRKQCPEVVSIHAPAWGATIHADGQCRDGLVSIHAPAWGATSQ